MEPGHEDRDSEFGADLKTLIRPQWSPVTKTGKTTCSGTPPRTSGCRNGARSRRPGRLAQDGAYLCKGCEPQWSPVTKTGKTLRGRRR